MDARIDHARSQRGFLALANDFLRWLLFVVMTTAAIAAVVFYFVHERLDDEIRRYVEAQFRAHYRDLEVTVRSARRIPGVGIELRGVSLRARSGLPRDSIRGGDLAYVDELLVQCSTNLNNLLTGQAKARRLTLRRLRVAAECRPDGTWTTASLLPLPHFGNGTPVVVFEGATLALFDARLAGTKRLELTDINLEVVPEVRPVADGRRGEPVQPPLRRFRGRLRSNFFAAAALEGQIDVGDWSWTARGTVEGLENSPQALASLPQSVAERAQLLTAFRGRTRLSLQAQGRGTAPDLCRFAASGLYEGRIEDPRLPQPLTDVRVKFSCDNQALHIEQATARAGEAELALSGDLTGLTPGGPLRLRGSAKHLLLDQRLSESLPGEWRCLWDQFHPRGTVNLEVGLASDGRVWSHDLSIECLDLALAYHRFPYPLEKVRGQIRLRDGVLDLSGLSALASGRPLRLEGQFRQPGPKCTGWIEFAVEDPIPLDEQLFSALPGTSQQVVRSLQPHGSLTVSGRYERLAANPPVIRKRLEIGLRDCSMNYERFPYPLYRIRGTLSMADDHWVFRDLQGGNDSGWVVCNGTWAPSPQGGTELLLDINAMDVPLEDELRNALKPEIQQLWNSLCPRGTIDQLRVGVRFESSSRELAVDVAAHKRPPEQNVEGRSITVKPAWLPYEWENVVGSAEVSGGKVELKNVHATHGDTSVEFSGRVATTPSGAWQVHLAPFCVDRVNPTRELMAALPKRLGDALARLNVSGLVSMSGSLELAGVRGNPAPPTASWALDVDLEDGGIECGTRLEHIHGGILLEGKFDGSTVSSRGELGVDSVICKGIQLTRVAGPVHMEDARLWLGEWIPEALRSTPPRPVTANAWSGLVSGNAEVTLGDETEFNLDVRLAEGDLAVISREATVHKRDIRGRTFANVLLSGNSSGIHTLRGRGRIELREADIYELPVIVAMLKPLSLKPVDRTAFTSSDVDFRVEADRIYFDRLDFDGDAISLDGRGEMSLDRQIQLTFGTTVGRDDYYTTLIRPLLKEAGRRLLVLHVSGTLDEPEVRKELVPELSERFQHLFPNAQLRERPQTSQAPQPRRFFDPLFSR